MPSFRPLQIKTSLTIKPNGFYMHVKKRKDGLVTSSIGLKSARAVRDGSDDDDAATAKNGGTGPKLAIYYGE